MDCPWEEHNSSDHLVTPIVSQHPSLRLFASPDALRNFSDDVKVLWCGGISSIPLLDMPPSSLVFLRDFVSASRPCIIRHALPASTNDSSDLRLTLDDLVKRSPDLEIVVDVTPDGHGDCVRTVGVGIDHNGERKEIFVKPEQRTMTLSDFQSKLRSTKINKNEHATNSDDNSWLSYDQFGRPILPLACTRAPMDTKTDISLEAPDTSVYYYSRQNDCWRTELGLLSSQCHQIPDRVSCIDEAFGTGPPDAMNLWIGDERAVSSMHKDHYENLFYVLDGEKIFTLCPPADAPFLPQESWESGTFHQQSDGSWCVRPDDEQVDTNDTKSAPAARVRWIQLNVQPLVENDEQQRRDVLQRHPLLSYAHPIQVKVAAGEMLYLPSLWFHRVTQSCETVAINYWYDMKFDSPHWCYFNFLQEMKVIVDNDPDS